MTTSKTLTEYLDSGGDLDRHPGRHDLVGRVFLVFGGKAGASPVSADHTGPGLDAQVSRWTAEALADQALIDRLWLVLPVEARRWVEDARQAIAQRAADYKAGERALDAFDHYQRKRNFSEKTIGCRHAVLASFNWHDGTAVSLFSATRPDVERWLDGHDRLGPQGRYTYISHLHAFYRFAIRDGLLTNDPTATIDRPRLPERLPRPLSAADLRRALEAADDRVRAFLCLGAFQGFRIGDMAGLRREDVLDAQEPATLRVNQGKGKKDRILPAHPKTLEALHAFGMPESGPIFTSTSGGHLSAGEVGRHISFLFAKLGIDATPHALRHTFGTNVYARSRDLLLTQRLMGHGSCQTTMSYVGLNPDEREVDVVRGLG